MPKPYPNFGVPKSSSGAAVEAAQAPGVAALPLVGQFVESGECDREPSAGLCVLVRHLHVPEVEEWQIELRKKDDDPMEVDEMIVHLAVRVGTLPEATAVRVREMFHSRLELTPNHVRFLELESMLKQIGMETEMKERRFVDCRPKT